MVYEVRLKDAINKGWLVPFKYYGIYDETVNYEDIDYKYGKYDDKQLEEALMLNKRGELILNHYQKYNSQRAMGFCSSRHHAEYMAKVFNENKVSAAAVYSGERGEYSEERDIALAKLTSGELKVIFSVDMFNEGLDVPQIDMVMFLRPTQSPTIFLQQLGRGLRKAKDKKCLNVLDFIGNYKKANLVPFLLSGKEYSAAECKKNKQGDYEFPEECIVDFDFRIIDIFKKQAEREMKVKDKIKEQFDIVSDMLGHRPSRVELFTYMDDNVYQNIRSKNKSMDPFKNYLEYIKENDELSYDEEKLYNSRGREFINMIETTSMSKTYKMPVLLAFYNDGDIKMEISEDDIYKSFYDFYRKGSNKVDMLKDKSTSDFMSWDKKKYISLAKNNPIKFLIKTHGDFFKEKDNCILALQDDLKELISSKAFKEHMLDAIDLRVETYYKNRFFNKRK